MSYLAIPHSCWYAIIHFSFHKTSYGCLCSHNLSYTIVVLTTGFCFNDGRQHEIKKSVFAVIIPQPYMCSRVFPTRVRGRLLGEKCIILLQCWPLIAPFCPQTPYFAPFHVHNSIRNLWGFKCTLSPPRIHQQLVYISHSRICFFYNDIIMYTFRQGWVGNDTINLPKFQNGHPFMTACSTEGLEIGVR